MLEALAPSGPEVTNWVWVYVELTFADGSNKNAALSVCGNGSYWPTNHVFVVP